MDKTKTLERSCKNCLHRQYECWSGVGYCQEYEMRRYESAQKCTSYEEHDWSGVFNKNISSSPESLV